jgi:hypothetical protein
MAAGQCECEFEITQTALLAASRVDASDAPPAIWTQFADLVPAHGATEVCFSGDPFAALPPDDPVSRAQILRL